VVLVFGLYSPLLFPFLSFPIWVPSERASIAPILLPLRSFKTCSAMRDQLSFRLSRNSGDVDQPPTPFSPRFGTRRRILCGSSKRFRRLSFEYLRCLSPQAFVLPIFHSRPCSIFGRRVLFPATPFLIGHALHKPRVNYRQVAPVPTIIQNLTEDAPGPSPLGTGGGWPAHQGLCPVRRSFIAMSGRADSLTR